MNQILDRPWMLRHKQRRDQVAQHAAQIVADEGIEAATVRRIAASTGFSTTIVTHYFATKEELLEAAFEAAVRTSRATFEKCAKDNPTDILACLMASVPLDDDRSKMWRISAAMNELAKTNLSYSAMLRKDNERSIELLAAVIRNHYGAHVRNTREIAESFILVTRGLSMQILADPTSWNSDKASKRLECILKAIFDDYKSTEATEVRPQEDQSPNGQALT